MDLLSNLEDSRTIISYVDEVIIPSKTVDKGLVILNEFLQAIRSASLFLRPSKCFFLKTKLKFLGHLVTAIEKTICISNYGTPQADADVRKVLGITGFFRKFVKE